MAGLLGDGMVLAASVLVAGLRWVVLRSSERLIGHDKARYDELWQHLRRDAEAEAGLERLAEEVCALGVKGAEVPRCDCARSSEARPETCCVERSAVAVWCARSVMSRGWWPGLT